MMTGSEGSSSRSRLRTSMPSSFVSLRSSSRTSTECSGMRSSASAPDAGSSGVNPKSRAHSPIVKRSERSSSTTSSVWGVWVRVGLSPLAMAFLQGEVEHHRGPAALPAGDLDAPLMLVHDRLGDREPQPGADGLGGEERMEQLAQHAARHA